VTARKLTWVSTVIIASSLFGVEGFAVGHRRLTLAHAARSVVAVSLLR